jgi:hypothetical protein
VHVLAKLNDRVGYASVCESSILQGSNNMSEFNVIQDGFTIILDILEPVVQGAT